MRSVRRRKINLRLGASLGLLLLMVGMWVRSYWVADLFFWSPSGVQVVVLVTTRGQVHVHDGEWLIAGRTANWPKDFTFRWFAHRASKPAMDSSSFLRFSARGTPSIWYRLGFRHDYLAGYGTAKGWQCPIWCLCVPTALLPLSALRSAAIARRRRSGGRCAFCGYDLRASSGVCPECGERSQKVL